MTTHRRAAKTARHMAGNLTTSWRKNYMSIHKMRIFFFSEPWLFIEVFQGKNLILCSSHKLLDHDSCAFLWVACGQKIYQSPKSWSNLGCRKGGILILRLLLSFPGSFLAEGSLESFVFQNMSWLKQTRSADCPRKSPGKRPTTCSLRCGVQLSGEQKHPACKSSYFNVQSTVSMSKD